MPKILEFRGHSDDTFGWDATRNDKRIDGDDHDDCADRTVRAFLVDSPSTGKVYVTGAYSKVPSAVWMIGLAPFDEDVEIPAWARQPTFRTDGYSPVLTLHVPDDAVITLAAIDGDEPEGA